MGASGLVGSALLRASPDAIGTYRSRAAPFLRHLDARDTDALRGLVDETGATTLYFPAAQPNVEWCETHPEEAEADNLDPLHSAIAVTGERGMTLVAYSSDYVFDGAAGPYGEAEPVSPVSVYGRIKVKFEEIAGAAGAIIVRTTGVFGREAEPRNFVLRLVASLERGETVRVPMDQISTPTYADDLARASTLLAKARVAGVWNVAGPDVVSRDELARRAAAAFELPTTGILPVTTRSLAQRAARPLRGGLRTDKLRTRFGQIHRPLDEALADLRRVRAA